MRRIVMSLAPKVLFIISAVFVILLAKGWQFDLQDGTIVKTGILDTHSQPKGAAIALDGKPAGLTPQKVTGLKPQRYLLTLTKDNYQPWQKNVVIHSELSTQVYDVILFADSPVIQRQNLAEFSRLAGSNSPQRIVVLAPSAADAGSSVVYVYSTQFELLFQSTVATSLTAATVQALWSPDLNSCILNFETPANGKPSISGSYFLSIKGTARIPSALLTVRGFAAEPETLRSPVWSPDNASIITIRNGQVVAVSLSDLSEQIIITESRGIQPLFTAPPSGFFQRSRLYYLKARTDNVASDLWYQELPDGSSGQISASHPFSEVSSVSVSPDFNNIFLTDQSTSTILMNISSQSPGERTATRPIKRPLSWSPDGERFLFISETDQISYYDQLKDTFLYPYTIADGEQLDFACWHPDSLHIFFQTTNTTGDQVRHQIKAIEFDGKNLVTVFDDREDFPGIESLNPTIPILTPNSRSLVMASIIERKTEPALMFLYSLRYD